MVIPVMLLSGCRGENRITLREQPTDTPATQAENISESVSADSEEAQAPLVISPQDELIIIWNTIGEPGQFPDAQGNPTGFQPDVVRSIMDQMGQRYRFVREDNYDLLFLKLKAGEAHMASATVITEERLRVYKFGDVQDSIDFHLWVHEDNTDIGGDTTEESIHSLFGKKLGLNRGSNVYESLRPYKEIEFVYYHQNLDPWPDLVDKEIDAIVAVDNVANGQKNTHGYPIKTTGALIYSLPYAHVFYGNIDDEFIERFNQALQTIKENGTYDELKMKWFGP